MTVKIWRNPYPLKNILVSDSSDHATAWSEIETVYNAEFAVAGNPLSLSFPINLPKRCPMQMISPDEEKHLVDVVGVEVIDDAAIQAIGDAYQAANP